MVNKACPGGPYVSFFAEVSADSGYELGNTGYRLADVDIPEDTGLIAITGSLKDSNANNAFRHRLVSDIQLSNNSPSPAIEKKEKKDSSKRSPAPGKK